LAKRIENTGQEYDRSLDRMMAELWTGERPRKAEYYPGGHENTGQETDIIFY
jgi:hypothetical protein